MRSAALAAAIAIVITACQATPEPAPSPTSVAIPTATATASPSPSVSPKVLGGTLRVAVSTQIGALDPRARDADPLVIGQVFEGLVMRGPTGPASALATKWLAGPDGRAWTFTLRDAVTFHDGSVVDGPAVAKSFSRADDPI